MAVLIDNQQARHPLNIETVRKKAQAVLSALGSPDGELSVILVDDVRIARLNQDYLQRQGPTNVIAFSMREGAYNEINPHLLGDVVISMETCAREAQQAGMLITHRFDQLLIHGILHIFGYDHVQTAAEARRMDAKAEALLAILNQDEP